MQHVLLITDIVHSLNSLDVYTKASVDRYVDYIDYIELFHDIFT